MTIKSKTFYVSEGGLHAIKNSDATFYCTPFTDGAYKHEVTISWKEDRKAEVTESQIDEIAEEWCDGIVSFKYEPLIEFIKERVFKDAK